VDIRHRLKQVLRELYARGVYHSGAHRLLDRCMPRRLMVLAGHCVATPGNEALGPNMRIGGAELELHALESNFAAMIVPYRARLDELRVNLRDRPRGSPGAAPARRQA